MTNSEKNPMRSPKVDKVVVHMGVGESGQHLVDAENILEQITGQKVIRAFAKMTAPAFGIRKKEPIGCKVTLRGENAKNFLETSLQIIGNTLNSSQFDATGNVSFGIEEHTDFPGMKYDPNIGVFGMDVVAVLKRPGARIAKRRIARRKIPGSHRMTREEAISFFEDNYNVEVI
ncbi:MAG: 50S ribosomal protein L5 [Methanosarcinaceae archaeon]|nr:50S ribosomal protein L5 [Methanosarcinaceae archaeon]